MKRYRGLTYLPPVAGWLSTCVRAAYQPERPIIFDFDSVAIAIPVVWQQQKVARKSGEFALTVLTS